MSLPPQRDVAVIGMACRVAGANSPSELWDMLAESRDVQSEIRRFNARGYYHPDGGPLKGLTNVKDAYMMSDDLIDRFDNAFFRIMPQEAAALDPQQRMLLEVAYEAIENAGIRLDDISGSDTAVFAGVEGSDYHTVLARDIDTTPKYLATGTPSCMAANRISYFFNLSGASYTVDSACSSSMSALHQAVTTLQMSESKMALVCSAKLILNPDMFMPATEMGFLSPSGRCQTFDAGADGYGRGEGSVALLLRPLEDAVACNDPIRAIIKGTRLNQDGRTQGITLPSSTAQVNNMRSLYSRIGLSPDDIQYFEAHGTGTAAGDPLEAAAINTVFDSSTRSQHLVVGSVKSNIGHLEACSALAAIVKTIESLERGRIPAQMHFRTPNPKIDFSRLHIPREMLCWPRCKNGARLAAVNSFGAGGTNGHAILQAYERTQRPAYQPESHPLLFQISANTDAALAKSRLDLRDYLTQNDPNLVDLAYTLSARRSIMSRTSFFAADSKEGLVTALGSSSAKTFSKPAGGSPSLIFVFTGQGAQWPCMGKELMANPIFNDTLKDCQNVIDSLSDVPKWSLIEELSRPPESSNVYNSTFSQPLCTVLQIGLVNVLRHWGLTPEAVVGHSSGEIAAAYAAGIINMRDAVVISYFRGSYLGILSSNTNSRQVSGSMCAVNVQSLHEAEQLLARYDERVQLAAINSPTSYTLSGDADAIMDIVKKAKENGIFCRQLRVDTAFHSKHVYGAALKYGAALEAAGVANLGSETCPMLSSVTGKRIAANDVSPAYWVENMVQTVKYGPAFLECLSNVEHPAACVEIGSHPSLKGPTTETARSIDVDLSMYFATCFRGRPAFDSVLENAAEMIAAGIRIDVTKLNGLGLTPDAPCPRVLTDLPTYAWDHSTSFWYETDISKAVRGRRYPRHLLLGSRAVDDSLHSPCWRNYVRLDEISYLKEQIDHDSFLNNRYAIFISMAAEAAKQLQLDNGSPFWKLVNFEFAKSSNVFSRQSPDTIKLHFNTRQVDELGFLDFEILSFDIGSKTEAWGRIVFHDKAAETDVSLQASSDLSHDPDLVSTCEKLGWGIPSFLTDLRINESGATGSFDASAEPWIDAWPDLEMLQAVLSIPILSMSLTMLPASHRIVSVRSISLQPSAITSCVGKFHVTITASDHSGSLSNLCLTFQDKTVFLEGVQFEIDHLRPSDPPFGLVLSRPTSMPDISHFQAERCTLDEFICLVCHKWPMADVAITGVNNLEPLIESLTLCLKRQQNAFRSLHVQPERPLQNTNEKISSTGFRDTNVAYRLLVLEDTLTPGWESRLHPLGIILTPDNNGSLESEEGFERVTSVTGITSEPWMAYRRNRRIPPRAVIDRPVVFSDCAKHMAIGSKISSAQFVPLNPPSIGEFCQQPRKDRFTALVFESSERSVIGTWAGQDLMPWFRHLMWWAKAIVWVSQQDICNPFHGVAGILLRTLQAEQPSLKVAWIVTKREEDEDVLLHKVYEAYRSFEDGAGEIKISWTDVIPTITRYKLDDRLCAMTGISAPIKIDEALADDYSLVLGARQIALFSSAQKIIGPTSGFLSVKVEASIVDTEDLLTFGGQGSLPFDRELGFFFSGIVASQGNAQFAQGTRVVGWTRRAHSSRVTVSENNIFPVVPETPYYHAAATLAAIATTLTAIDGIARVRPGDIVQLNVSNVLDHTFSQSIERAGGSLSAPAGAAADFTFNIDASKGLTINGRPMRRADIQTYLASPQGSSLVKEMWTNNTGFPAPSMVSSIAESESALSHEPVDGPDTVLLHDRPEKRVPQLVHYERRESLFRSEGIYVLIGGLGGLGRYVCSWMISRGAKSLVIMSRSGTASSEAQSTVELLRASGTYVEVMKVNACDQEALRMSFATVRQRAPIKGVVNMAMVLADAAMDSMTRDQWDTGLRLKIDSSWNLHQETLQDELDFFILFSSIASVLGNRNQGNYNVGNGFLNALAEFRHTLGLPAVSLALGAMTEIGVLHELGKADLLQHLSRAGLMALTKHDLGKLLEAAIIIESPLRQRPVLVTGLETFERVNGKIVGKNQDQTQLFWTELPEFSHLQNHRLVDEKNRTGGVGGDKRLLLLKDMLRQRSAAGSDRYRVLMDHFLDFVSRLQGFSREVFEENAPLSNYGLDSLGSVSIQFWFHREAGIELSAGDVLNAKSIAELVNLGCSGLGD